MCICVCVCVIIIFYCLSTQIHHHSQPYYRVTHTRWQVWVTLNKAESETSSSSFPLSYTPSPAANGLKTRTGLFVLYPNSTMTEQTVVDRNKTTLNTVYICVKCHVRISAPKYYSRTEKADHKFSHILFRNPVSNCIRLGVSDSAIWVLGFHL